MVSNSKTRSADKTTVYVTATQHFDILWRKPLNYYRKTQADVINRVLQICDKYPDFRFAFHQANVLRHFLERHPEQADKLHDRISQGAIEILGGMETIPDANMTFGESLVRNIVYGRQWVFDNFAVRPTIGSMLDCFGSSGQLPQIFAGTGHTTLLAGRMPGAKFSDPSLPTSFLWRGLDGTKINGIHISLELIPADMIDGWYGWGVLEGYDQRYKTTPPDPEGLIKSIRGGLKSILAGRNNRKTVLAVLAGEEHLPQKEAILAIRQFANDSDHRVKFTTFDEFVSENDWDRDVDVLGGEYNVEFSGCYTTRIELKQWNQRAETLLYNSEYMHCLDVLQGRVAPDPECLKDAWRDLFVCQFHDALCGCHIDENYRHIIDAFQRIEAGVGSRIRKAMGLNKKDSTSPDSPDKAVRVVNTMPRGRKDVVRVETDGNRVCDPAGNQVPCQREGRDLLFLVDLPAGAAAGQYQISQADGTTAESSSQLSQGQIQTGRYRLDNTPCGPSIADTTVDRAIFRPGEIPGQIVLKEDTGTLWTEDFTGLSWREEPGRSSPTGVTVGDLFARLTYCGQVMGSEAPWDGFESLTWRKTFYIYRDLDRIDFHVDLEYNGRATEISLLLPTNVDAASARGRYEIPFGSLVRRPYSPGDYKYGRGNWPAVSWCDYCDDRFGIAIAHTGTPGVLAAEGVVSFSLLRSATTYHEPLFPTKPEPLSFNNGQHHYEFCLIPHDADDYSWLPKARGFVIRPITSVFAGKAGADPLAGASLSIESDHVVLSSLKPAEDGSGVIVRAYETLGRPCQTAIRVPGTDYKAVETSLDETRDGAAVDLRRMTFQPFEVKTIKLSN